MNHLAPHDVMVVFLALAALLASANFAGELVKKFNQPSVLGEIIAGILLGPTVLGHYKPAVYALLFPHTGPVALLLDGVTAISVVFFLLTAGIEIDLASIFRQGKSALLVSSFGMVIPFAFGFLSAGMFPRFLGADKGTDRLVFALFIWHRAVHFRSSRGRPHPHGSRIAQDRSDGRWTLTRLML